MSASARSGVRLLTPKHPLRGFPLLADLARAAVDPATDQAPELLDGRPGLHVRQLCRIGRRRICPATGEIATDVTYAITSLPPDRADATALLARARGRWGIENRLHYVRDRVPLGRFDEGRCQVRSGAAPQAFAACRNRTIALLRRRNRTDIAAASRTNARRPPLAAHLVRPTHR